MAYVQFDPARPDTGAVGATRQSEIKWARDNLTAIQDMLAAFAGMRGFNVTVTAGTLIKPTTILATNSTQVVRQVITYGSGVTADLPVTIVYSKSVNSGGAYDTIATNTITYDASGNFDHNTWS